MFWETCLLQICIERNTDDETSAEKLEETVEEIRATDRQLPSFVMGRLMTPSVCIQCKMQGLDELRDGVVIRNSEARPAVEISQPEARR